MGVESDGDAQIVGGCVYPGGGGFNYVITGNIAAGRSTFVLGLFKNGHTTLRVRYSSLENRGAQLNSIKNCLDSHNDRQN